MPTVETSVHCLERVMRLFDAPYLNIFLEALRCSDAIAAMDVANNAAKYINEARVNAGSLPILTPAKWIVRCEYPYAAFEIIWRDVDGLIYKFVSKESYQRDAAHPQSALLEYPDDSPRAGRIAQCLSSSWPTP